MTKSVKQQVQEAMDQFSSQLHASEPDKLKAIRCAFLSGASLTAHFIAATDGNPNATPSKVEQAIADVGLELGMTPGKM